MKTVTTYVAEVGDAVALAIEGETEKMYLGNISKIEGIRGFEVAAVACFDTIDTSTGKTWPCAEHFEAIILSEFGYMAEPIERCPNGYWCR